MLDEAQLALLPEPWQRQIILHPAPLPLTGFCWLWMGRLNRNGYARGWCRKQHREPVLHRAVYEDFVGPIPDDHLLDHLCRRRNCINWLHMEPVPPGINVRRGEAILFGDFQRMLGIP